MSPSFKTRIVLILALFFILLAAVGIVAGDPGFIQREGGTL